MPTILIIDDEAGIRYIGRMVFSQRQWTVIEAENGEQGLQMLAEHHPDIILLDYRLPDMLGSDWLCAAKKISQSPVVLVSASSELATLSHHPGVAAALAKPFRLEKLWQTVQGVLPTPAQGSVTVKTDPPPGRGR